MQRKQETIHSQKTEITTLREENAQLSDMLGQAVATLEAQSSGGLREIVQSIDSEFAGLLDEGESQADGGDGGRQGPGPVETEPQEGETQEDETQEAEPQEGETQEGESEGAKWDPENESAPALQRILARHNH